LLSLTNLQLRFGYAFLGGGLVEHLRLQHIHSINYIVQAFFFDRAKKTQGRKNSKLKENTQNSSKKLKDSANFGVIYCQNQRKGPKNKGETT